MLLGWHAVEVTDGPEFASAVIENEAGGQRTLTARWVVGADGPRSLVRQAMGARDEGAAGGRPNVNITFRSNELAALIPHPDSIHYWVLNPAAPGVVGPLDLDGNWWAISTGTTHVDDADHAAQLVRSLIGSRRRRRDSRDRSVAGADALGPTGIAPGTSSSSVTRRTRTPHGAATDSIPGSATPSTWGGSSRRSSRAGRPDELLVSYGIERRPIEEQTIALAASNMASLSIDLSNPLLMASGPSFEAARDELGPVIRRVKSPEFYSAGLVLGYGYGPTSMEQTPTPAHYLPAIAAGNRLPHRFVGERSIYDQLGPWFTALGSADAEAPLLAEAERRGIPVTHLETGRFRCRAGPGPISTSRG